VTGFFWRELLFLFFEHVLAYAAEWADPIFRQIFESDIVVVSRIVDITADSAYVFHELFLLLLISLYYIKQIRKAKMPD
jgi:hypothetical protein